MVRLIDILILNGNFKIKSRLKLITKWLGLQSLYIVENLKQYITSVHFYTILLDTWTKYFRKHVENAQK